MYILKNMKISVRLFLLSSVQGLSLLFISILALYGMDRIHEGTENISQQWLPSVIIAEELRSTVAEYRLAESAHILAEEASVMQNYVTSFTEMESKIEQNLSAASSYNDAQGATLLQAAQSLWSEYLFYHAEFLIASTANNTELATSLLQGSSQTTYYKLHAALDEYVSYNKEGAESSESASTGQYRNTRVSVFALMIIALVGGVIFSQMVIKTITVPIEEIEEAASRIANGDLNVQIEYASRDKLGTLANSMRSLCQEVQTIIQDLSHVLDAMAHGDFTVSSQHEDAYIGDFQSLLTSVQSISGQLSRTLGSIDASSLKVSAGSVQVAHAAQLSAEGANKQATVVEHLSSTIKKILERMKDNADRSNEAKDKANDAAEEIETSTSKVSDMMESMDRISEKSSEIAKIIKVIDDIAFQTNILALNAAVEAARAGQAGRGFAVVADEVRNLADKSASSARDTAKLIDETMVAVKSGTKVAEETAESIYHVKGTIVEVREIMDVMAVVQDKQQHSMGEITQEVEIISTVVQQNSGNAEESASASQELSGESNLLKSYVSQFRLKEEEGMRRGFHQASTPVELRGSDEMLGVSEYAEYHEKY